MKKRILIFSGTSLYPKIMASQDRVINLIIELSKKHDVDLAMLVRDNTAIELTKENLGNYLTHLYPIKAINPIDRQFKRKFYGLMFKVFSFVSGLHTSYYYQNNRIVKKGVLSILANKNYDIFHIEYWYFGNVFKYIKIKVFKVIDMHMISFDDLMLYAIQKYGSKNSIPKRLHKAIMKTKNKEMDVWKSADLLIPISIDDKNRLASLDISPNKTVIHTGQDINYFFWYPLHTDKDTIIFYGSMSGAQNIFAFHRFWNKIYPIVLKNHPQVKVLVIGANPPENIIKLGETFPNVIVTGFVDDVREYISKGKVMILPLEVGVGFRSRTVEVMAMGVPVVGTHNALDNIEMKHGVHGYITDNDVEMAEFLVKILKNESLYNELSNNCRKFAKERYSLEATYGKLSDYYYKLEI